MRLEHIGIAVKDARKSAELLEELLGLRVYKVEEVESEAVSTRFLGDGAVKLELVEPTSDDAALGRYLSKYGEGLHHLAFEVDDVNQALVRLRDGGFRVLSEIPYAGADGKSVFFVHPLDTNHILFEFCQSTRPVLEPTVLTIGTRDVRYAAAGNPSSHPVIVSGVDPMDPIIASLETDFRVLLFDDHENLTPDLTRALFKDRSYSILIDKSALNGELLSIDGLDPVQTVILTADFGISPDQLPGGPTMIVADSASMTGSAVERMSHLAGTPNVSLQVIDSSRSRQARRLLGDSISLYMTSRNSEGIYIDDQK